MKRRIQVSCCIEESPRAEQLRGLFDLSQDRTSTCCWDVHLPLDSHSWNIGLITGPSGSGKSAVAKQLWPVLDETMHVNKSVIWASGLPAWSDTACIVDGFPEQVSIKRITSLLAATGLSSPPAWLRPYKVLSTGQQCRCDLARLLAYGELNEGKPTLLFDE